MKRNNEIRRVINGKALSLISSHPIVLQQSKKVYVCQARFLTNVHDMRINKGTVKTAYNNLLLEEPSG